MGGNEHLDDLYRRLTESERRAAAAERLLAEAQAAGEREADHRRLLATMDQGLVIGDFMLDADGRPVNFRYLELNPALERLSGLKVEDTVGRWITDVLPEPDARYWIDAFGSVLMSGVPARFEQCVEALDQWYDVYVTPLGSGRIATVYDNVTDRKRAEASLRLSEERFRALATAGSYSVYRMSPDWRQMYHLEGRSFLADTPAPLSDWMAEYLLPEDAAEVMRAVSAAIRDRALFELEHRVRRADGTVGWVLSRALPMLDDAGAITEWVGAASDITFRKEAELALRQSEERQAFLLRLTDALRPLGDPVAVQETAARMLGVELRVDRCHYAEFDWARDVLRIHREYVGFDTVTNVGEHPISAFHDLLRHSHKGEPLVCDDIAAHPVFGGEVDAYRARGTDAFILIPLVKQGVMAACMCVTMRGPRRWTPAEVDLVRDVADRTWEASQRIRAEGAMRESEERFRQFANASSGALWIRDADTLTMEYVSPAIEAIYGEKAEAFLDGVELWASSIVPDDRDTALLHLQEAREGRSVVHEFRIQRPDDGSFRWIRNIDFPLHDDRGRVVRIGGIAEDVTEARLATEHQDVLLAELQHRVRNIMAVIRSIVARTAGTAETVAAYRELLTGRLLTLARVQALLTRAANAGVGVATIVDDELGALATHAAQFDAAGPDVVLSPKAAETMTLAVHELTTNALKYGALSTPDGSVHVRWAVVETRGGPWLSFDWRESGAPAPPARPGPRRQGFGSELIEGRIPYELKGRATLAIEPGGAQCHLEFPLVAGASILETDAPQRATVFGGAIDMAGEADLGGQHILVIEDDYYLATDTARALKGAGATVVGPCPTEESAREEIAAAPPTGAVLDINLEGGRSFGLARDLRAAGTPFVFVTGYDQDVIPAEFDDVARLQKPVEFRTIVSTLAEAIARAAAA